MYCLKKNVKQQFNHLTPNADRCARTARADMMMPDLFELIMEDVNSDGNYESVLYFVSPDPNKLPRQQWLLEKYDGKLHIRSYKIEEGKIIYLAE
ncbi:MAG: hypothetical protein V1743_01915 [Nanoarchaeota archaeon]